MSISNSTSSAFTASTYIANRPTYLKRLTLSSTKGKDWSYLVMDTIIKYKVQIYPALQCQCKQSPCCHLFFVLFECVGLSEFSLKYIFELTEIYDLFISLLKKPTSPSEPETSLNTQIEQAITLYLQKDNCGLCLNALNDAKYQLNLMRCSTCSQFCHQLCYQNWQKKKGLKAEPMCIYCGLKTPVYIV